MKDVIQKLFVKEDMYLIAKNGKKSVLNIAIIDVTADQEVAADLGLLRFDTPVAKAMGGIVIDIVGGE